MDRLELLNVTKVYEDKAVIDDVSFSVEKEEFFALLGPSGAGKTTILNMIAGITDITKGEIRFDGKVINRVPPHRRDVAMTFENYVLYSGKTVYENMAFPLKAPRVRNKYDDREIDRRINLFADMLQISPLLGRYPDQLSGGERQRVSLGRMLVRDPEAFLMDEPIAHLDAQLRYHMRSEIKSLQREKRILTVYTTPDQAEAVAMADRIGVLEAGILHQVGTPDDLYKTPADMVTASLVGDPPMNFFTFSLTAREDRTVLRNAQFEIEVEPDLLPAGLEKDKKYKVGIRPTDMNIIPTAGPRDVPASVYVTEQINRWNLISLMVGDVLVQVRTDIGQTFAIDQDVGLSIKTERLHFFDPESGLAIRG